MATFFFPADARSTTALFFTLCTDVCSQAGRQATPQDRRARFRALTERVHLDVERNVLDIDGLANLESIEVPRERTAALLFIVDLDHELELAEELVGGYRRVRADSILPPWMSKHAHVESPSGFVESAKPNVSRMVSLETAWRDSSGAGAQSSPKTHCPGGTSEATGSPAR